MIFINNNLSFGVFKLFINNISLSICVYVNTFNNCNSSNLSDIIFKALSIFKSITKS